MLHKLFFLYLLIFIILGCSHCNQKEKSPLDFQTRIKHQQYYSKGKVLYTQLCANCHQLDGSGLGKLYPPLLHSDYMKADVPRTINLIKKGLYEEIKVNGVVYFQEMPANPDLTNLEIAELSAYIYKKFTDTVVFVAPDEVEQFLTIKQLN
jgi:cytochrome c551